MNNELSFFNLTDIILLCDQCEGIIRTNLIPCDKDDTSLSLKLNCFCGEKTVSVASFTCKFFANNNKQKKIKSQSFCLQCQEFITQQKFPPKHDEKTHTLSPHKIIITHKCRFHVHRTIEYFCFTCNSYLCSICYNSLLNCQHYNHIIDKIRIANAATIEKYQHHLNIIKTTYNSLVKQNKYSNIDYYIPYLQLITLIVNTYDLVKNTKEINAFHNLVEVDYLFINDFFLNCLNPKDFIRQWKTTCPNRTNEYIFVPKLNRQLRVQNKSILKLQVIQDNKYIAICSGDEYINIYKSSSLFEFVSCIKDNSNNNINCFTEINDNQIVYASKNNLSICSIKNIKEPKHVYFVKEASCKTIISLSLIGTPNPKYYASASIDGSITIWKLTERDIFKVKYSKVEDIIDMIGMGISCSNSSYLYVVAFGGNNKKEGLFIWNFERGGGVRHYKHIKILSKNSIQCVQEKYLVLGGYQKIIVLNVLVLLGFSQGEISQVVYEYNGFNNIDTLYYYKKEDLLYVGNSNGEIIILNPKMFLNKNSTTTKERECCVQGELLFYSTKVILHKLESIAIDGEGKLIVGTGKDVYVFEIMKSCCEGMYTSKKEFVKNNSEIRKLSKRINKKFFKIA